MVNATPWPLYPRERPGVYCIGAWVGPGSVWTGADNLAPTWIWYPDRPASSESLYWLSSPCPLYIQASVGKGNTASSGKTQEQVLHVVALGILWERPSECDIVGVLRVAACWHRATYCLCYSWYQGHSVSVTHSHPYCLTSLLVATISLSHLRRLLVERLADTRNKCKMQCTSGNACSHRISLMRKRCIGGLLQDVHWMQLTVLKNDEDVRNLYTRN